MNEWNNEDVEKTVYIFHNIKHDIFMYINCEGAEECYSTGVSSREN